MNNIEEIIKELNDICLFIAGRLGVEQARCFLQTIDKTVALLKEQEEKIKTMHIAQNVIADYLIQPEIVRCRDCKHGIGDENAFICGLKQLTAGMDWYCADGEAKDDA